MEGASGRGGGGGRGGNGNGEAAAMGFGRRWARTTRSHRIVRIRWAGIVDDGDGGGAPCRIVILRCDGEDGTETVACTRGGGGGAEP
uniref:Uncharacterized protein n=1 Tax=Oryza rufipogon TaxID=4529 RepID=A0A0E0QP43_ORYRU